MLNRIINTKWRETLKDFKSCKFSTVHLFIYIVSTTQMIKKTNNLNFQQVQWYFHKKNITHMKKSWPEYIMLKCNSHYNVFFYFMLLLLFFCVLSSQLQMIRILSSFYCQNETWILNNSWETTTNIQQKKRHQQKSPCIKNEKKSVKVLNKKNKKNH